MSEEYIDLIYFFYYPYNRGKEVLATVWGNHVGDWEHVSVRLVRGRDNTNGWPYLPAQIHLSAHRFGATFDWDAIAKTNITHPVVYAAEGSHGLWQTSGVHVYKSLPIIGDLSDSTNAGKAWDTWNRVEAFDFNLKQGLAGSVWPLWMDDDFKNSGVCASTDPACGAIYRWGNQERGCDILGIDIGICRLENGPTGPVSKGVWSPGPLQ